MGKLIDALGTEENIATSPCTYYIHDIFVSWTREIGGYYCSVRPIPLFDIYPSYSVSTSFSPADPGGITNERSAPYVRTSFSSPSVIHKK